MLIKAQPRDNFRNVDAFIRESVFLDESESIMTPYMVPVQENSRLNANIIRIEDLNAYAESNGITDAGYAIDQICEASEISPESIVFSIQEENMILGEDEAETALAFLKEGGNVVLAPLSMFDKVSIEGEIFLEAADLTGDYEHFLCEFAILNEEWQAKEPIKLKDKYEWGDTLDGPYKNFTFVNDTSTDATHNATGKEFKNIPGLGFRDNDTETLMNVYDLTDPTTGKTEQRRTIFHHGDARYNFNRTDLQKHTRRDIDEYTTKLANAKSEEEFNDIKKEAQWLLKQNSIIADHSFTYNGNYISKKITDLSKDLEQEEYPKSWLAKKIAWFRSLYAKFMNKNKTVRDPGVFGFIKKICAMILNIIDKLARKLQHAVN